MFIPEYWEAQSKAGKGNKCLVCGEYHSNGLDCEEMIAQAREAREARLRAYLEEKAKAWRAYKEAIAEARKAYLEAEEAENYKAKEKGGER